MKKLTIATILVIAFVLFEYYSGKNAPALPNSATNSISSGSTNYKDGTYTGSSENAFYGNIQVQAVISGGKLTNVTFLQYPNDQGHSIEINQQADPILAQEAVQSQSAQVDTVSGATDTSQAFIQSLSSALSQAKS